MHRALVGASNHLGAARVRSAVEACEGRQCVGRSTGTARREQRRFFGLAQPRAGVHAVGVGNCERSAHRRAVVGHARVDRAHKARAVQRPQRERASRHCRYVARQNDAREAHAAALGVNRTASAHRHIGVEMRVLGIDGRARAVDRAARAERVAARDGDAAQAQRRLRAVERMRRGGRVWRRMHGEGPGRAGQRKRHPWRATFVRGLRRVVALRLEGGILVHDDVGVGGPRVRACREDDLQHDVRARVDRRGGARGSERGGRAPTRCRARVGAAAGRVIAERRVGPRARDGRRRRGRCGGALRRGDEEEAQQRSRRAAAAKLGARRARRAAHRRFCAPPLTPLCGCVRVGGGGWGGSARAR